MIFKLVLFGIWGIAAVQAFPSDSATIQSPEEKTKACDEKLAWYRDTTRRTQELFDKYYDEYKKFRNASNPNASHIESQHSEFEQKVTTALDRYQDDAKKIYNISDESARLAFCAREINWFKLLDQNLTKTATNIKTDVLNILKALGVPKEVIDNLDQILSRIVNFLFIIDMTKNTFKDVKSLVQECFTKTEQGVKLEKKYEFNGNGELVETAAKIDEEFKDALKNDDVDNKLEGDLIDLGDDRDVKTAEDKAIERMEEEVEHNKENEVKEPVEEFRPEVIHVIH